MSRRQAAYVVLAIFAGMPAVHRVGVAQEGETTAKGEAKVSRPRPMMATFRRHSSCGDPRPTRTGS